ncbi:hypothetical protein G4B88_017079 [Cannabis sativa]|uniref:RNase H type-1 domain-containing protein n=1 Tax=Cannabis sativa TaxID=3483 RepID=A0A7J6EI89_CANSA|nr:hypothetical protein G4B88_017079 [Cannabis sativa]
MLLGDLNGTLVDHECINYTNQHNSARYSFDLRRMFQKTLGTIGGASVKRARLDRALASIDWRLLFPNAIVEAITVSTSDHKPILLNTDGGARCTRAQFKYELMWGRDPRCLWVVRNAWRDKLHQNPMTTTLCIVEEIWKERNKRVHGEIESDIIKVITLIRHKNEDHMLVSTKNLTDVLTWSPPPASWLCCNSDVAISSTGCMLAAVFRDEFSNIVSITTSRALFTEPLLAEAHAVCLVADYAANMGLNRVLFQSDNLGVVKEFRNSESPIADFRLQVAKLRFQKSCTNLLEWDINHISRKCNFLVHNIAKWAVFKNVEGSLKPSELDGSVMDDLVEWDPGSRSNGSGAMV